MCVALHVLTALTLWSCKCMVIHSLAAMQSDFPRVIPGLIQDSDFGSVRNVMRTLFASI